MSQTLAFNKTQKLFLQSVPLTSLKGLDSFFPILQKQNIYQDQICHKNRKNSFQPNLVIPPLKLRDSCRWENIRYTQEMSTVTPTKKTVRPWAAKPARPANQSKYVERTDSTLEKTNIFQKRKSGRGDSKNRELANNNNELNSKQLHGEFGRVSKAGSMSERQGGKFNGRDRTNSCRVAVKKGVFPINRKQYEQIKLCEHFEREEEKLSTIPGNSERGSQKFISMDSYTQLIF